MSPNRVLPARSGPGLTTARFALLLLLGLAAFYPGALVGSRTLFYRDFGFFGYPLAFFHRESFWRAEIPLWNPLNCCGLPFLAQWNTLVVYPGSLLYLLLPMPWSLNLFCLGHLFLAGLAMYWLAWEWVGNRSAAAVAGVAFALNGLSLNSLMWPNNIAALGWMPLVVLCVQRAWQRGGRYLIGAGLVGALQMLTGAPEIVIFTWLFLAVLLATDLGARVVLLKHCLPRCALVVGWVATLSAVQLLPFAELLGQSHREESFARSNWPMPMSGWANLLVPLFRTYAEPPGVHFQIGQYWTTSYYVGIGVLAMAILAVGQVKDRRVWLLAGVVVTALVLALGENGFLASLVQKLLPPLRVMRFPIKYVVLAIFALPLLAAFGSHQLMRCPVANRRSWRQAAVVVAVLLVVIQGILWYGVKYPLPLETGAGLVANGWMRSVFLCVIFGLLILVHRSRHPGATTALTVGLLAVLAADALTHMPRQNPTVDPTVLQPRLLTQDQMNPLPRPGQSRAMASPEAELKLHFVSISDPAKNYLIKRLGLVSNCNLLEGIPCISGFFSLYLREANRLRFLVANVTNRLDSPLYDFLGISQITRPGSDFEWQVRPSALPAITAGQEPLLADDAATLRGLIGRGFDPRSTVFLPPDTARSLRARRDPSARVNGTRFDANRVEVDATFERAGLLVIAQSFCHGWQASIDGQPATILRANYAFQAVSVPAGRHRVRLEYGTRTLAVGLGVSVSALIAAVVAWIRCGRGTVPALRSSGTSGP